MSVDAKAVQWRAARLSIQPKMGPAGEGGLVEESWPPLKENGRLQMEREISKPAAQFFAREWA